LLLLQLLLLLTAASCSFDCGGAPRTRACARMCVCVRVLFDCVGKRGLPGSKLAIGALWSYRLALRWI
jgi:hypothetical protein